MVTSSKASTLENIGTSTPREALERYSPVDGSLIFKTPMSSQSDVEGLFRNIDSQENKFQNLGVIKAARLLYGVCTELNRIRDEINHSIFLETAKPESLVSGEFEAARNFMLALAGLSQFQVGRVIPSSNSRKLVYTRSVPYGTAALITSHNTPLPNYAWKMAPSFLSLNSSILKPSEYTSSSAQKYVECFLSAGVPEFMVNLLHGGPSTVEALVLKMPELVSFTGSFETGLVIKELTKSYSPKLILEMGGSNPIIVCSSANLKLSAKAIVESAFSNSGQRCASASRLIVHHNIFVELLDNIRQRIDEMLSEVGKDSFSGGIVNISAKNKHLKIIEMALESGAQIEEFSYKQNEAGQYVNPTLIFQTSKVSLPDEIEVFSPIIYVQEFGENAEALELANNSSYALTAAVWTNELRDIEYFSQYIKSGVININGPTHGAEFQFPFGGLKNSGNGAQEVGMNCLTEYAFEKIVSITHYE